MAKKEYKTYRQLLTVLRSRGMEIGKGSMGSRVMRILEKENYYNYFKDLLVFIVENNYLNEDIQIIEEEFKEDYPWYRKQE